MSEQTNIPAKQKPVLIVYDMSDDTRIREAARMREKRLHDEASALYNAEQKGRAEGRAEGETIGIAKGRAEGRAEGEAKGVAKVIEKMRASGMTDEQIKAIIGE